MRRLRWGFTALSAPLSRRWTSTLPHEQARRLELFEEIARRHRAENLAKGANVKNVHRVHSRPLCPYLSVVVESASIGTALPRATHAHT